MISEEEYHNLKNKVTTLQSQLQEEKLLTNQLNSQLNDERTKCRQLELTVDDKDEAMKDLKGEVARLTKERFALMEQKDQLMQDMLHVSARGNTARHDDHDTREQVTQTLPGEYDDVDIADLIANNDFLKSEVDRLKGIIEDGPEDWNERTTMLPQYEDREVTPANIKGNNDALSVPALNFGNTLRVPIGGVGAVDNSSFNASVPRSHIMSINNNDEMAPTPRMRAMAPFMLSARGQPSEEMPGDTPRVTMQLPLASARGVPVSGGGGGVNNNSMAAPASSMSLVTPRLGMVPSMVVGATGSSDDNFLTARGSARNPMPAFSSQPSAQWRTPRVTPSMSNLHSNPTSQPGSQVNRAAHRDPSQASQASMHTDNRGASSIRPSAEPHARPPLSADDAPSRVIPKQQLLAAQPSGEAQETKHLFQVDDETESDECQLCALLDQVHERFSGCMVDKNQFYAVGWIPEMCNRWMLDHQWSWTIEEKATLATILYHRPTLEAFKVSRQEGYVNLWRSRFFLKSPWKQCYALLQGAFLYIFPSREPDAKLLAATLVRGAQIETVQCAGKDNCIKLSSLCCANCVGATDSDSVESMTLSFEGEKETEKWSETLLATQQTCPHRCSAKFVNELHPIREVIEILLAGSTVGLDESLSPAPRRY